MIKEALDRYRSWRGRDHPHTTFRLECSLSLPASEEEIAGVGRNVPLDMADLWRECRDALLFEDVEYGQWGLHLLSPSASVARTVEEINARPDDFTADDIVVGEFLGDLELLALVRQGESYDVRVVLPLDPRPEWSFASATMDEFLVRYYDASGEKYWAALG